MAMATTAALSLKELRSIIELSSASRATHRRQRGRNYRRRNSTLEAITCIDDAARLARDEFIAQRRE
jgi:hypothetical protein